MVDVLCNVYSNVNCGILVNSNGGFSVILKLIELFELF